ncbi:MAG TPA: thioredoxin domain-containing protein [Candidatus Saccharimonadales bacterium]|nr:thioredoxin domain-containing protein [Candidatus Saccharimonadales bacterium]
MSKTFWTILVVIVVVFGGILLFKQDKAAAPTGGGNSQPTKHIKGSGTTGVVLVEYGDFECPFCAQYYPLVEQVAEKYKDQITFQFRHLPILEAHRNAFAAARAAEAASDQGKFWEMYNLLFQNQETWSKGNNPKKQFEQYAAQLGLNVEKFKTDSASSTVNDRINADLNEFKKTGLQKSTPTFILDGKKIEARSLEEFSKLIDEAIAKKQKAQ